MVALSETAVVNKMGVVDDEKAWTDLVEVFSTNQSKSMAETLVSDHLAATKAVSLGTHFHHELALRLINIFVGQIDAISFVNNFASDPISISRSAAGALVTEGRIR